MFSALRLLFYRLTINTAELAWHLFGSEFLPDSHFWVKSFQLELSVFWGKKFSALLLFCVRFLCYTKDNLLRCCCTK